MLSPLVVVVMVEVDNDVVVDDVGDEVRVEVGVGAVIVVVLIVIVGIVAVVVVLNQIIIVMHGLGPIRIR